MTRLLKVLLAVGVCLTTLVQTAHATPQLDSLKPGSLQAVCCPAMPRWTMTGWAWPLPGSHITQRYNSKHPGLDLSAPVGSQVRAVANGVVRYAADTGGPYGKLVIVRHVSGCETWYAHLNTIEVHGRQAIPSGKSLGQMGGTGNAQGWHLHLEVRAATSGGAATVQIDPWLCLTSARKTHRHQGVDE
ncbi:peptidoglycan LD-endopeptidase LytH [Anaerolineae bacterium]|nr:peptidoglycan LD-endopeptidase LytH [Anaerolineae bacterium]